MKKWLFIILICFVAKGSSAQNNQWFTWDAFQLIAKVNSKWHWISDVSYRTIGVSASANQYTFRSAVKRVINGKWSATAGVALFNNRLSVNKDVHEFDEEFRLWQEAAVESKINQKLVLQNRFRTEERFFQATSKKDAYTAFRLRYRLALTQNITDKIKFQFADEYMRQLAKGDFLFQQNRVAASGIFVTGRTTQLQVGYMWSKMPTVSQHYILLVLQKTISFKKEHNG